MKTSIKRLKEYFADTRKIGKHRIEAEII